MHVKVASETTRLRSVVLGYPDNFHSDPTTVEIVNATQQMFYDGTEKPTVERLKPEFDDLKRTLEDRGIEVFYPKPCSVPDQLTPRDIAFVIGETIFIAQMAKVSRKNEYQGIQFLLEKMSKVSYVPENVVIEGGDIIVDKGVVFVGISQRTTMDGYRWLAKQIPDFKTVPVTLKSLEAGEDCLHLDCVFVPVGTNQALVYQDGFDSKVSAELRQYQWLNVTREEQSQLATNVLSLTDKCVISRHSAERVNELLQRSGIEVIPLKFDEAPKTGGSFRCCTLPLVRE